ncbi:hypothetical protein E1B28_003824 [Marasmius oreades]|uniref:F-box domain-containing protein n=1 Tax=Marasmius oreades TaxID=181124 RepID=A0A9P7UXF6_9AGAR|nr:uncharacterized protein E1B28_003824 [Marasmius oreades]KAG7096380.1 hypothetical protein E1B28_003824 [Marasmius oreades]
MRYNDVDQLKPLLGDEFCKRLNAIFESHSSLLLLDNDDDDSSEVLSTLFEGYSPFQASTDVNNDKIPPVTVSHISRLPTEILVEIFKLYVDSTFDIACWSDSWMKARPTPPLTRQRYRLNEEYTSEPDGKCEIGRWPPALLLSRVSNRWHDIALDMPYLWSFLHIKVGTDDKDISRLLYPYRSSAEDASGPKGLEYEVNLGEKKKKTENMLRRLRRLVAALVRSENLPLKVCLTINLPKTDYETISINSFPILRLLMAVSPRWNELYAAVPVGATQALVQMCSRLPLLETLMWKTVLDGRNDFWRAGFCLHGPAIRKLILCNIRSSSLPPSVTSLVCTVSLENYCMTRSTLNCIGSFPSQDHLQHLSLTQVDLYARVDFGALLTFNSLRSLSLITKLPNSQRSAVRLCRVPTLLDDFITPQLESLYLDGCYGAGNNVRDMLLRSGCLLRELEVRGGLMSTPSEMENLFMRVTPGLWKLTMSDCSEVDDGLIRSMTPGLPRATITCVLPELIELRCEMISLSEEVVRGFVESRWKIGAKDTDEAKFDEDSFGVRRPQVVALEVFSIPGSNIFNRWERVLLKEGLHITIKRKQNTPFSFSFSLKRGTTTI